LSSVGVRWPQIDVLILDGTPEPLYENVVQRSSFAIHANAHVVPPQYPEERLRSELRALVGIEDLRRTVST